MENWTELSTDVLSASEYTNAERGWQNTETDAEVIVYNVTGTGMEDVTEKDWAVQHPIDEDDENTHFFESFDAAEEYAEAYIEDHPEPANEY